MKLLTRICTCFRQWDYVASWIEDERLFDDFTDWVIVNDSPKDPPPEKIKAIAARRAITIHQPVFNLGRASARNLGVRLADSEFVEHIDGDDLPLPLAPSVLDAHRDLDLIFFDVQHHAVDVRTQPWIPLPRQEEAHWRSEMFYLRLFERWGTVDVRPCATLWKRSAYENLGGYDGRFDTVEDLQLVHKAYLRGLRIGRSETSKQSYHVNPGASADSEFSGFSLLRFWLSVADREASPVSGHLRNAYRGMLWSCLISMRRNAPPSLAFRIKESMRWILRG